MDPDFFVSESDTEPFSLKLCSPMPFFLQTRLMSPELTDSMPGAQATINAVMLPRAPVLTR